MKELSKKELSKIVQLLMKHGFPDYSEYAISKLHDHLIELGFPVKQILHINEHRNIQQEGKHDEWSYLAWYQRDKEGNTSLICSAGFTQIGEQSDITIPIPKSEINLK